MAERFDIAFVGCGNLGMAILSRAVAAGAVDAARTLVAEADPHRREQAHALGVHVTEVVRDAASAHALLLAVKPQSFREVAAQLEALRGDQLVISVMAGWSSATLRAQLGGQVRVVRAMPNMPAQVGLAMTAIATGSGARSSDAATAMRLFDAVGRTVRVDESQIDAMVAAGGSAPAYLFYLAQAQIEAGVQLGLTHEQARTVTVQTMLGAATMMAAGDQTPQELRAAVTSKGGTTAAAIAVLDERGFAQAVADAMRAARDRSAQLGK